MLPTIEDDYKCKFSKNGVCNTRWLLRDWRIDITAPASREPLFDNRWEGIRIKHNYYERKYFYIILK